MLDGEQSIERKQPRYIMLDPEPRPIRRIVVIVALVVVLASGGLYFLDPNGTAEGTPADGDAGLTSELCHQIMVPNVIVPFVSNVMPDVFKSCENLLGD